MADLSTQLRVLSRALALGRFSAPELAALAGVKYETAKKVLRDEHGRTVARTGETTKAGPGRPAKIWIVIDAAAIAARLEEAGAELQGLHSAAAAAAPPDADADTKLALAEDYLLFALDASDVEDAQSFAADALEALGDSDEDGNAGPVVPAGDALARHPHRRNLATPLARSGIVRAVGTYVASEEATGIAGPLWRAAFSSVALVEVPDQDALHKALLVDLVRAAHARRDWTDSLRNASVAEIADLVVGELAETDGDAAVERVLDLASRASASGRDALGRALAALLDDLASGTRDSQPPWCAGVLAVASPLFAPESVPDAEVLERVVGAICTLARSVTPEVASQAQEALVAMSQPRHSEFWLELAGSAQVAPPRRLVFQGIAQTNLLEAYAYLRGEVNAGAPVDEVLEALSEAMPRIDARAEHARERFADFLASVTNSHIRNRLAVAPVLAGLDWPVPSLERRQMHEFMVTLRRWRTLVRSGHHDQRVAAERDALAWSIEKLASDIFPLLTSEDERQACDALTTELRSREGARLAVRTLLAVGRTTALAEWVVARLAPDDELWHRVAQWYLEVCPRDAITRSQRAEFVNALAAALPGREGFSFYIQLVRRGLPELDGSEHRAHQMRVPERLPTTTTGSGRLAWLRYAELFRSWEPEIEAGETAASVLFPRGWNTQPHTSLDAGYSVDETILALQQAAGQPDFMT